MFQNTIVDEIWFALLLWLGPNPCAIRVLREYHTPRVITSFQSASSIEINLYIPKGMEIPLQPFISANAVIFPRVI